MARFTTIVALVADRADEVVAAVEAGATNVSAVRAPGDATSDIRSAWSDAERRRNVFTLTDFDPHAGLVDAWVRRLGGERHAMDAGEALLLVDSLPEYYFVDEAIEDDRVHWYLGMLRSMSPRRVVPVGADPGSVIAALTHLAAGPALPGAKALLRKAAGYVPTGLTVTSSTPHSLARP